MFDYSTFKMSDQIDPALSEPGEAHDPPWQDPDTSAGSRHVTVPADNDEYTTTSNRSEVVYA